MNADAARAAGRRKLDEFRRKKTSTQQPLAAERAHADNSSEASQVLPRLDSDATTDEGVPHTDGQTVDEEVRDGLENGHADLNARIRELVEERNSALAQRDAARDAAAEAYAAAAAAEARSVASANEAATQRTASESAVAARVAAESIAAEAAARAVAAEAAACEALARAASAEERAQGAEARAATAESRVRSALAERDAAVRRSEDAATRVRVAEHRVAEALSEQSAAEAEAAQLRTELAQLRSRESIILADNDGNHAALASGASGHQPLNDDERAALVEELSSVRRGAQRAEMRCAELESKLQEVIARIRTCDVEMETLHVELTAAQADAHAARQETDASRREASAAVAAAQAEMAALRQSLDALQTELQAARRPSQAPSVVQAASAGAEAVGSADAAAHASATARVVRLEAVQSRLLHEIDAQGAEIERLFADVSTLQSERARLEKRLEDSTAQNSRLRERVLELGDSPTPRKGRTSQDDAHDLTKLHAERDALQAAVSAAVRREESLERQLSEARLQLSMAQAGAMVGADAPPALSSILGSIEARLVRLQSASV